MQFCSAQVFAVEAGTDTLGIAAREAVEKGVKKKS